MFLCFRRELKAVKRITASQWLAGSFFIAVLCSAVCASAETLTLPEGLKRISEKSRLVMIAEEEEGIAGAETSLARAKLLPSLNASVSQTFLAFGPAAIFGRQTVPVSERNFLAYSLILQQTLYDFQANASRLEASRVVLNSKKLDTRRIRNLAAIEFVLGYLDLLEAEKMLSVAQKEVDRLHAHSRDAHDLYEEGMITKNDLLQAEVKISDAHQRLLAARHQREIAASRLNSVLARPLKAEIQVAEVSAEPLFPAVLDHEGAWAAAERDRIEVQILDAVLAALSWEMKAREAEYYPKFFFRGGYDYTENKFQLHEGNWTAAVGMNLTLFSGGSTKAETDRIEGQKKKVLRQKEKVLDDIRLEVEQALLETRTAAEKMAVAAASVEQAEENLRINRVRYEEGTGTATEVLDAISLLTVSETNHYRALYGLRKAEAAVLYATGKQLTEVYR